ncbi:MAG TPA: hypothetical protein PKM63_15145 [Panacibacter sp.]|nr:hypothetical protein [Panacibacter sp.]HNP45625.1 hypothetical protein [Panacibacter sp.]
MKKNLVLLLAVGLFLASCQKSNLTSPTATTSTTQDELSFNTSNTDELATGKTRTELISQYTWMYKKYYLGYQDPNNLGTLLYLRGATNNSLDLDNVFVTYHADGTVDEDDNGTSYPGTWYFSDPKETIIVVTNSTGTYTSKVLKLNNKTFIFEYTDIYGVNRAGQYVPFK